MVPLPLISQIELANGRPSLADPMSLLLAGNGFWLSGEIKIFAARKRAINKRFLLTGCCLQDVIAHQPEHLVNFDTGLAHPFDKCVHERTVSTCTIQSELSSLCRI